MVDQLPRPDPGECAEEKDDIFSVTITQHLTNLGHLPDSATSAIGTPCSYAMKPRTEKMAKPATKLVPLFRQQSMMQSLWGSSERGSGQRGWHRLEHSGQRGWHRLEHAVLCVGREFGHR